MIVKNIKIKNFKSFGNNINKVELDPSNGELILLHGINGSGKSSTLEAIDFALYGKVRGKKKKYVTSDCLPNRYNGDMLVEIEFESATNNVKIIRSGTKLELYIDGEKYDRAGKANIQQKIEDIVGIDIETFKSFISMSINDFKNFMVLTPDEKRMLLDRLFNLEMINELGKIIKEKKKQNKHEEEIFNREILTYQSNLQSFKEGISKIKEASKINLDKEREEIKNQILNKKNDFDTLKDRLDKGSVKELEISNRIKEISQKIVEIDYQIRTKQDKIKLIDSGKCHVCESDLSSDIHTTFKNETIDVVNKLKELKNELSIEYSDLDNKKTKLVTIMKNTNQTFGELKAYLSQLKMKLSSLLDENIEETSSINEMINTINVIEKRKELSEENLSKIRHTSDLINHLDKMFSEEGIKKSIISKIVKPINHFIKENLEILGIHFMVQLDDQFSAEIKLLGQDIDPDTLSTGETKKVNIAIMLAYLKLIRMKKHINLLFLDEVFSSIDIHGIYDILKLLKVFSREYNVNTFLIHHALLEKSSFDRVLKIEKNITSQIIEE
jgi:exonuclease SbcC